MSETPEGIICRAYTAARRHPKVVGVIGGKVLPWPSTNAQLGVFIGTALTLLKTRGMWGAVVPAPLQFVLVVGLPVLGWWAVRFWHPEGRSPAKAAVGAMNYATRPRRGSHHGRAVAKSRGVSCGGTVFAGGAR